MILGLGTATFTMVHIVLSLLGIGSGFVVVFGLLTARPLPFWSALFIAATALATLTGFLFPFHGMTLGIELGIPTLAFLMLASAERYTALFPGMWRHTYVVSVMIALYCSVAALVAQIFARYLAPTARTPWEYGRLFEMAEAAVFVVFAVVTHFALKNFKSRPGHRA
jgi:uncharacterized membrane protein YhdT